MTNNLAVPTTLANGFLMPFCAAGRMDLTDDEFKVIEQMHELNKIRYPDIDIENENFIHMWIDLITYPDFARKNEKEWFVLISDMGIMAKMPLRHTGSIINLPVGYFTEVKEGDRISLIIPILIKLPDGTEYEDKMIACMKLKQKDSRYANLGNFEDALRNLTYG